MIYICVALALFSGGIGAFQNFKKLADKKKMQKAGGDTEGDPLVLNLPEFIQPFIVIVLAFLMVILQVAGLFERWPVLQIAPVILMALYIGARSKRFAAMIQQEPEHGLINKKSQKKKK